MTRALSPPCSFACPRGFSAGTDLRQSRPEDLRQEAAGEVVAASAPTDNVSADPRRLHCASCFPWALTGEEHVQQVVLKIYVAGESLVVLAEKEGIGKRKEQCVVTWRDRIERLTREQRRLRYLAVPRLQHQPTVVDANYLVQDILWK